MHVLPSCLLEPLWDQFAVLLPTRQECAPTHPLRCHRRRIPDQVVFEHIVQALVHGSGYGDSTGTYRWTFIGCNPNGQWGWLPDSDVMADAFAEVLLKGWWP